MSQQKNLYTGSPLPFRVRREQLAQLVLKAKLEPLDQRVILEILDLLDHRVNKVSKVKLGQLGLVVL
jgi:hypothetical protein